jgi:hypothetical protein
MANLLPVLSTGFRSLIFHYVADHYLLLLGSNFAGNKNRVQGYM